MVGSRAHRCRRRDDCHKSAGASSRIRAPAKHPKATTQGKAAPAKVKEAAVTLPEAESRRWYWAGLSVVLKVPPYRAKYSADLPPWLDFDADRFLFFGLPTETESTVYSFTLTVSSLDNPSLSQKIALKLPVRVGPPVAYDGKPQTTLQPKRITDAKGGRIHQWA